jgi:hypothetical protein
MVKNNNCLDALPKVFDVGAPKVGLFCPNIFKDVSLKKPAHSAAK